MLLELIQRVTFTVRLYVVLKMFSGTAPILLLSVRSLLVLYVFFHFPYIFNLSSCQQIFPCFPGAFLFIVHFKSVNFIICLLTSAPEAGNLRGYSPNIAVESIRKETGGAIPRPMKQVTRTTVKREPIGNLTKRCCLSII